MKRMVIMGQIGQLRREWENGFGYPTGVDIIVTVYWCSKEKSVGVVGIDIRVCIVPPQREGEGERERGGRRREPVVSRWLCVHLCSLASFERGPNRVPTTVWYIFKMPSVREKKIS